MITNYQILFGPRSGEKIASDNANVLPLKLKTEGLCFLFYFNMSLRGLRSSTHANYVGSQKQYWY